MIKHFYSFEAFLELDDLNHYIYAKELQAYLVPEVVHAETSFDFQFVLFLLHQRDDYGQGTVQPDQY